jgi:LysR family glycine cleavage system transcriptional activator
MVDVAGINLGAGTTYSHTVMVMQAAIHSQGVAIVHSILGQRELDSGRLIRPFDIPLKTNRAYDFACPEGSESKPKVKAFREWLKTTLENDCEHDPLREGRKQIISIGDSE